MTGSAVTTVPASASPTDPCLSALSETLGADLFVQDEDARAACLRDMTGNWPSGAQAVARPRSTAEVGRLVQAAAAQGIAIVPQGGNTGLVGGCAVPAETPALLLSTRRLRSIRAIDLHAPAVIAEAGCILAEVQEAVAAHGFTIPLGLGSEGSATIGGLVSTNAGGIRALRHGVMRNQVLGLEVVLPDGRVWNGLRTLAKNNMGYDLKQLFVGGEGTLGVVTAAALRLVPASRQIETLWLAVEDPAAALALLGALRTALGDLVTSFELIQRSGVEWGMATDTKNLYVTISDAAAARDRAKPGVYALNPADGKLVWSTPAPRGSSSSTVSISPISTSTPSTSPRGWTSRAPPT